MKKNPTLFTALIFILIACLLFGSTFMIQESKNQGNRLGPRFFPRLILLLIVMFNLILAYQAYRYPEEQKKVKKVPDEKRKRFIGTIVISVLVGFSFTLLGGFTTIFFFVLSFLIIWGQRKLKVLFLTPTLVTLGAFLLFYKLLSVRMPKGIIDALFY